jgi:hypothetical protein
MLTDSLLVRIPAASGTVRDSARHYVLDDGIVAALEKLNQHSKSNIQYLEYPSSAASENNGNIVQSCLYFADPEHMGASCAVELARPKSKISLHIAVTPVFGVDYCVN